MRTIAVVIVILLFTIAAGYFLPWWGLALVAFACTLAGRLHPGPGFIAGFLGVFLAWLLGGLLKDFQQGGQLSLRMAQLFKLNNGYLFLIVAAVIGGVAGGLSGLTGALFGIYLMGRRTRNET